MKRFLFLVSVVLAAAFAVSCSDEHPAYQSDNDSDNSSEEAIYYVKYQFNCPYKYSVTFEVNTDTGYKSFKGIYSGWTETYGPVSKGFNAHISVSHSSASVKIYVSRGKEPFALKAAGDRSVSYRIE